MCNGILLDQVEEDVILILNLAEFRKFLVVRGHQYVKKVNHKHIITNDQDECHKISSPLAFFLLINTQLYNSKCQDQRPFNKSTLIKQMIPR